MSEQTPHSISVLTSVKLCFGSDPRVNVIQKLQYLEFVAGEVQEAAADQTHLINLSYVMLLSSSSGRLKR